jgi:hypothetical protein
MFTGTCLIRFFWRLPPANPLAYPREPVCYLGMLNNDNDSLIAHEVKQVWDPTVRPHLDPFIRSMARAIPKKDFHLQRQI